MLDELLRSGRIQDSDPGIKETIVQAREAIDGSSVPAYHSGGTIYLRSSATTASLTGTLLHELFHNLNWRDGQPEGEDNTSSSTTQRIEDDFRDAETTNLHHKYDMGSDACKCIQPRGSPR
jgi:hypothetical protein